MMTEEQKKYLSEERKKEIKNGALEHYRAITVSNENFAEGAEWADKNPSVETLLKAFWEFDKHGLIKEDLCFDPEHFMRTVIKEHWGE